MSLWVVLASLAVIALLLRFLLKGRGRGGDDTVSQRWLNQDKQRGRREP